MEILKFITETTGIILVFVVGLLNIIVILIHNKKHTFINSVTERRFQYITEFKSNIATFCALAEDTNDTNGFDFKKVKYTIQLSLNPEYEDWDKRIIDLTQKISNCGDNREKLIKELISICQYMLQIEWDGVQRESQKGILTEDEKEIIRNINLIKLKEYEQRQIREN
jgi:hypothetical protein